MWGLQQLGVGDVLVVLPSLCGAACGVVCMSPCGSVPMQGADHGCASMANGTPPSSGNPVAMTSMRRPSLGEIPGMPMSRKYTFSCTLPPASRKMRAHMRSSGLARRRTRPLRIQEARWSPRASSSLPQDRPSHHRRDNGNGHRSLRRKATCIRSGRSSVPLSLAGWLSAMSLPAARIVIGAWYG